MANVIAPPPVGSDPGSYAWVEWYSALTNYINSGQKVAWAQIDFGTSSLTDIVDRPHSALTSVKGTSVNTYAYHAITMGVVNGTSITTADGLSGWTVGVAGSYFTVSMPASLAVDTVGHMIVTPVSLTSAGYVNYWQPINTQTFAVSMTGGNTFSFTLSSMQTGVNPTTP